MKHYESMFARCPYYTQEEPKQRKIFCEGITCDSNSALQLYFSSKADYDLQRNTYCHNHPNWQHCPLAALHNSKWDEYFKTHKL